MKQSLVGFCSVTRGGVAWCLPRGYLHLARPGEVGCWNLQLIPESYQPRKQLENLSVH